MSTGVESAKTNSAACNHPVILLNSRRPAEAIILYATKVMALLSLYHAPSQPASQHRYSGLSKMPSPGGHCRSVCEYTRRARVIRPRSKLAGELPYVKTRSTMLLPSVRLEGVRRLSGAGSQLGSTSWLIAISDLGIAATDNRLPSRVRACTYIHQSIFAVGKMARPRPVTKQGRG